ncbi:MAG: carboxypeptidase-like regulatory domain-containing protein, partial [Myxococcota bacterium]|nr:carboxypeptidase-like regulatory domain-containing protein [Myxococcota bacterium]
MVRKTRKMPAVISTIALIAGCGSSAHAEVSGLVVDARTGLAIPGARVVAQDGSATRTDADGRFTLTLSSGEAREIRASAAGRVDGRTRVDVRVDENASIVLELVACGGDERDLACGREVAWDDQGPHDPDAVLRWIDDLDLERWLVRGVREPEIDFDGDVLDGDTPAHDVASLDTATPWGAREQWALGTMTFDGAELSSGGAIERAECAACHDGSDFAAAHATPLPGTPTASITGTSASSECTPCHDERTPDGLGLRVYENAVAVSGAPARGLGSGAICVECHRAVEHAGAHAPQADVVLGCGARTMA